jgi:hypothetical protein
MFCGVSQLYPDVKTFKMKLYALKLLVIYDDVANPIVTPALICQNEFKMKLSEIGWFTDILLTW